jgi:hypothetical protein
MTRLEAKLDKKAEELEVLRSNETVAEVNHSNNGSYRCKKNAV